MGHIVFWLTTLLLGLFSVAALLAWLAQWRWIWDGWRSRLILAVLSVLPSTMIYMGIAWCFLLVWGLNPVPMKLLVPLGFVSVSFLLGTAALLILGLQSMSADDARPAATHWPRGILVIGLGVTLSLHLATYLIIDMAAMQQAAEIRAEARALAISAAPAHVPDRDNAALLHQRAAERMGLYHQWNEAWSDEWNAWLDSPDAPFDPSDPKLREFLKKNASMATLWRQAASKPDCYFDHDYTRPSYLMLLHEADHVNDAARLLAVEARCKAVDGDIRGALDNAQAMFVLAEHVSTVPCLVMQIVAVRVDANAKRTLEAVLNSASVSLDDLVATKAPRHVSYRYRLVQVLRWEEASGLTFMSNVAEGRNRVSVLDDLLGHGLLEEDEPSFMLTSGNGRSGFLGLPAMASFYRIFLLTDDAAYWRKSMNQSSELASEPYYRSKDTLETFFDEFDPEPQCVVTRAYFPALYIAVKACARRDAQREVARVGLAMSVYRADNKGAFPESLQELVPDFLTAVPLDPFDGKPLRLKSTEQDVIVYSIGPDDQDDGGVPFDRDDKTGDVRFRLTK